MKEVIIEISPKGIDLPKLLEQIESAMIDEALVKTQGNKTMAARLLGLNRTTLVEKLRKRGLIVKAKKRYHVER